LNDVAMAQAVQNAVRPKFRGNKSLKSKVAVQFPVNLAEEYERIARQYMALLNGVLKERLPEIRRAIDVERAEMRMDADLNVSRMIRRVMERARLEFESKAASFGLARKIAELAVKVKKRSIREWKRVVHKTLGINIVEDYYSGEFYQDAMRQWAANNVGLIKTIPAETLNRMETIIENGYYSGKSNAEMSRLIQEAYGIDRDHAQFIARDQTAKLNADITQTQQKDAGVQRYEWSDSGDVRVRECHAHLNGKKFFWNDPPEMWYETKKNGRVYTGRHCHPGQDYDCRCVSLPVFDIDTLNLPWDGNSGVDITGFSMKIT